MNLPARPQIARYIQLVINGMCLPPFLQYDDAVWIGWGAYWEAKQKNVNPGIVIRRKIIDHIRHLTHYGKMQELPLLKYDGPQVGAFLEIEARVDVRRLSDRAAISKRSCEILALYREGFTMKEISERFDINESRVSQLIRDSVEKLRREA